jgi:hypothetical protein
MGLDLSVGVDIPVRKPDDEPRLIHIRYDIDRCPKLFDYIKKHEPTKIEKPVIWQKYLDRVDGYEETSEDGLGEPLTQIPAHAFDCLPAEELSLWNAAVVSKLRRLPTGSRVILYWN